MLFRSFVDLPLSDPHRECRVKVVSEGAFVPKEQGINDDTRTLSYLLRGVEARFADD